MTVSRRVEAFSMLGRRLESLSTTEKESLFRQAYHHNNWFTEFNVDKALIGLQKMLTPDKLDQWIGRYNIADEATSKEVGIVMAGNVPFVGFHDLMCALIAGHKAVIKRSSQDQVLMDAIIGWLLEIEPKFNEQIEKKELLKEIDAVIATGSDNTSRYFEYYFRDIPHIIRKNRTAVAVLSGEESPEQLEQFGYDIFLYFGLGCRNISKVFVPKGYDLTKAFPPLDRFASVLDHHKYRNNYDYNKSIYLVNGVDHLDTGFSLWTESEDLVSPISVVFYQFYETKEEVEEILNKHKEKIQCIVSKYLPDSIAFGLAQQPEVWDYADKVDTMAFLTELKA